MTTDAAAPLRTGLLRDLDDALVGAHEQLNDAPMTEAAHEALLAVAAAAFDAVVAWEEHHGAVEQALDAPCDEGSWRTRLDELRLQSALADMESRQIIGAAGDRARSLAERLQDGVEELARLTATTVRGDADIVLH